MVKRGRKKELRSPKSCIYCFKSDTVKNGSREGIQLWNCKSCGGWFSEKAAQYLNKKHTAFGYFHRMPSKEARAVLPRQRPTITILGITRKLGVSRHTVYGWLEEWNAQGRPNPIPLRPYYRISEFDIYKHPASTNGLADTIMREPLSPYIPPHEMQHVPSHEKKKSHGSFPDRPKQDHPDFHQYLGNKLIKQHERFLLFKRLVELSIIFCRLNQFKR